MKEHTSFTLINSLMTTEAVRKDRKNETCDMQAWYYQADGTTYAFAILVGAHGVRQNIPADRTYFIVAGEGVFIINSTKHPVAKGSIITLPKGVTYDFHSTGKAAIEFFVNVGFKLDLATIPS